MTDNQVAMKPTALQWIALLLLVVSVGINYADRGNLGVAIGHMQTELHLNAKQLGFLSQGFFWTYAVFQIVAGKLIDRWNVNWVYAIGFLVWSAATGLVGAVSSVALIFLLRLLLGIGESIAYPSYSKIIAAAFPEQLRGTANALIDAGSKLGPALGVTIGVAMLTRYGWRGMFVLIGGTSLLWLIPWCYVAYKTPVHSANQSSRWTPGYLELMNKRRVWGTVVGLFCGNYTWYFFLTWLPYYFEHERHYEKNQLMLIASLPFWAIAIASMLFGLLADAIIRRGYDPGRVRQSFLCLGMLGCCALMLPAVLVRGESLSNLLLVCAAASMGAWSSNHWALTQRMAGIAGSGKWTAFQNCLGNFAGVAGAWITGEVLSATHSFFAAFAIACVALLIGVLGYWFIVGTPNPESWSGTMDKPETPAYVKGDPENLVEQGIVLPAAEAH